MAKQVDSKTDLILFARGVDPTGSPVGRGKRFDFQPPAQSAQVGQKEITTLNQSYRHIKRPYGTLIIGHTFHNNLQQGVPACNTRYAKNLSRSNLDLLKLLN